MSLSALKPRRRARPFRRPPNQQRLPAGPLLSAVGSYATRRQLSLELLLDQAARRTLYRGRQSGELTLNAVENLCERLGLHPRELYGDAYDRAAFTYVARRLSRRACASGPAQEVSADAPGPEAAAACSES